jgi:hypothetical protein
MTIIIVLLVLLVLFQFKTLRVFVGLLALYVMFQMSTGQPEEKKAESRSVEQVWNDAVERHKQPVASSRTEAEVNRMADDDISIQNATIVQIAADVCGYRIKPMHLEAINYIFARNTSQFKSTYSDFRRQVDKNPSKFCRDMRTDYLAKMIDW